MNPTTDAERSDTERLDWLDANGLGGFYIVNPIEPDANKREWADCYKPGPTYPSFRAAIDAAMSLNQEPRT